MKQTKKLRFTYNIENAITPIDGRNRNKLNSLASYFSEFALDKYRVIVELKYLQKLSESKIIRRFTKLELVSINRFIEKFSGGDYRQIREIEKNTNHDVKAVEEYIKLKFTKNTLKDVSPMIHFGLTSDDTNNIAYGLMVKNCLQRIIIPKIKEIAEKLKDSAKKYSGISMVGRTHGQPAAPTSLGKEYLVYFKRLEEEIKILENSEIRAKLTGNTGNLNAHKFIFPKNDWLKFSDDFIKSFGLKPDLVTTQIEPYDCYIKVFNSLSQINNILLGLCQDCWMYIMLGYFKQKVIQLEVGSSALPHKVNPIYFEGAEGGFGLANALFKFYCDKLSYSRLQRDLSDSTVRRSFGIAFSYSLLSYQSVSEGLNRIEPNIEKIKEDLDKYWEVLSEPIQNLLRTKGYKDAYNKTKKFFRGKSVTKTEVLNFINKLKLKKEDKERLLELTPDKYVGYAEEIVKKFLK